MLGLSFGDKLAIFVGSSVDFAVTPSHDVGVCILGVCILAGCTIGDTVGLFVGL